MSRSIAVSPWRPGIDVTRDPALVPLSRVSFIYVCLRPTCNFAVPTFCNPAHDMSNTNFLTLPYVFCVAARFLRRLLPKQLDPSSRAAGDNHILGELRGVPDTSVGRHHAHPIPDHRDVGGAGEVGRVPLPGA